MYGTRFWTVATVLSGLSASSAIPVTLLPRIPSSAAVLPASSYAPAPASSVAPAPVSSTVPPPLPPPSSSVPSVVPSVAPSVVPSGGASAPPTTTTTEAPPPTTATPTPTWTVVVEVGSSSFNIGDADDTTFESLWSKACGSDGCDGGSPQTFTYNGIDAGIKEQMTGTFTMTGNVDNNQDWTNDLLTYLSAAAIPTVQCSQQSAEVCALKHKRETPGVADDCSFQQINQCSMVNYLQATMYDDQSNQKAQVTMNGASQADSEFPCDTFLGLVNGAATAADVAPPVAGGLAILQVVCDIATGN